jgi:hypothetical protein
MRGEVKTRLRVGGDKGISPEGMEKLSRSMDVRSARSQSRSQTSIIVCEQAHVCCMWPFSSSPVPPSTENGPASTAAELPLLAEPAHAPQPALIQPESPASLAQQDGLQITGYPYERLSMQPTTRWCVMFVTTMGYGFGMGATIGGRKAADRYRAMNAHRTPSTQAGWYLYHRSKSYHTTMGAVKEGLKFGGILSAWASMFMLAEEGLDHARGSLFAKKQEEVAMGQRDALNTTLAALMTAGLYTRWHRMDVFATTKMARMSVKYGLLYGLMQDVLSTVRGERPAYVSWLARKITRATNR